ncbi:uncharacterized protein L199_007771 [Kwoniella botswanensis]|uniref:uncharacterized protein n=1 Tax=Kwoniella botswanensis TaxID=1268659 RepID=UPI00315D7A34
MPPIKQSKKSSTTPKDQSNSKTKAKPKSAPQTLPFSTFPIEITSLIFSYIDDQHSRQDFYNYIQVSRQFYTRFIPSVYRKLELKDRNVKKIFRGANIDIKPVKPATRYESDPDFGSDCQDSDGGEDEKDGYSTDEEDSDTSIDDGKERKWDFGLHPQDIHSRKVSHLQHVKYLIITDRTAASTVAAILKEPKGNSDHGKPFSQLHTLSFGHPFLISRGFYPDCACETQPKSSKVTRQLATLRPKHVCADWSASVKFHPDEDGFDTYMHLLIGKYNLESFTWHGMFAETTFPWCPDGVASFRVFAKTCGGWNREEQEYYECDCQSKLEQVPHFYPKKKDSKFRLEVINLDCLGDIGFVYVDKIGKVSGVAHAKENESVVDDSKPRIKVTMRAQAEPCICCGQK